MLKSIATADSERSAKQENKASYSTDYIVPGLVHFFDNDWKTSKRRLKKEIFIVVDNIALTKKWSVVSNLWEFPKTHTKKIMFWPSVFPTKNQS